MDERNQNKIVHADQCLRIQMSIVYIIFIDFICFHLAMFRFPEAVKAAGLRSCCPNTSRSEPSQGNRRHSTLVLVLGAQHSPNSEKVQGRGVGDNSQPWDVEVCQGCLCCTLGWGKGKWSVTNHLFQSNGSNFC